MYTAAADYIPATRNEKKNARYKSERQDFRLATSKYIHSRPSSMGLNDEDTADDYDTEGFWSR